MMFKNSTAVTLTVLSLLLVGCGGDSDSPPDDQGDQTSLTVINANSANVDIQGAYSTATGCYDASGDGVEESIDITADSWTYTVHTYAGDTTCTAGDPVQEQVVATLTVNGDGAVSGWVNGNRETVDAPAPADGSATLLPADSAYTLLNLVATSSSMNGISVGDSVSSGYVVDDSSADGLVLYRLDVDGTGVVVATIADPYTNIPSSGTGDTGGGTSGGPNLIVTIDSVINTGYSDTEISYTVRNIGDTVTDTFRVMGWYDRTSVPDYNSAESGKFNTHGAIPVNGVETGVIIVDATTVTPGTALNAYVIADYDQAVTESDEGLTGTSDNLSHMAWTVRDVFVDTTYGTFIDGIPTTSTQLSMTFSTGSNLTYIWMNYSADTSVSIQLVLVGEVVAGIHTYLAGEMGITTNVVASGTVYGIPVFGAAPAVSVTIDQAGAVGELVTGSYSMDLCPGSNMGPSGCTVAPTNFSGSFSMVRDINAG